MMLAIERAAWSEEAAGFLAPAMRHEPGVTVATLAGMVECGSGELFAVLAAGQMVGAYVLRVDRMENGKEGVIVAAGGRLPGYRLLRSILPVIEANQMHGCNTIRIHTARPGIAREMRRAGYVVREIVLAKGLEYGRQ